MNIVRWLSLVGALAMGAGLLLPADVEPKTVLTGKDAFTDYTLEKPGTFRKLTVADLPQPYATKSAGNGPKVVAQPAGAWPQTLPGFKVERYVDSGLDEPREIRTAPNGDFFVAESRKGEVKVFRGFTKDGKPEQSAVFATGLKQPFGIAFYPPGNDPKWVYVGNTGSVVRFPYKNGDLQATGQAEIVIPEIPAGGGHWTRDLAFTPDGKTLFVSVGSRSNVDVPTRKKKSFIAPEVCVSSRPKASSSVFTLRESVIRSALASIPPPASCGAQPMSATSSVTTWCRTT